MTTTQVLHDELNRRSRIEPCLQRPEPGTESVRTLQILPPRSNTDNHVLTLKSFRRVPAGTLSKVDAHAADAAPALKDADAPEGKKW
jgi:hypothetical protein